MIGKLLSGLLNFVIGLIGVFLSPIESLIATYLPQLDDVLNAVNVVIDYIINSIAYVIDASGLTPLALFMIVSYYTFSITATLSASVAKLLIKWYKALVP